jgi:hypothetical protein
MPTVFANGRSIIHKGDGFMQTCPVPDVCKTPSPGGPIPIPYPNMAMDGDLADGAKTVTIEGNPPALENSNLMMSTGDEAGSAGGGIASSKIKGKLTWAVASLDVKFDGKGVVRFLDICMHNGNASNTGSQPNLGAPNVGVPDEFNKYCPAPNHASESFDTARPPVQTWLRNNDKRGPDGWNDTLGQRNGGGFLRGTTRVSTIKKGERFWRAWGGAAGAVGMWCAREAVSNPIRKQALPEGSTAQSWALLEAKHDVAVLEGEGAPRCSNKPGGTTQICFPHPAPKHLRLIKIVPMAHRPPKT